jgi:hypothetical protein
LTAEVKTREVHRVFCLGMTKLVFSAIPARFPSP